MKSENTFKDERIIIFGASRGLGAEVKVKVLTQTATQLLISRKLSGQDLSRVQEHDAFILESQAFNPTRIFYFAGGGPYGLFNEKNWRDHEWTLNVNFLFPMKLIHFFSRAIGSQLRQIIVTGSAIAESGTDANAVSYSTAKHALKALVENLQFEKLGFNLRLFSPGYMNTDLLPKKADVRSKEKILDPSEVAQIFCDWALDPSGTYHKIVK